MGHKVNPISFRVQVSKDWQSKWFAKKSYADYLHEDLTIRNYIMTNLGRKSGVSRVKIERNANLISVTILTSRPGVIIGRGGTGAVELKSNLSKLVKESQIKDINIEEVREPEADAQLVGDNVAGQLERRMAYKRAIKQTAEKALKSPNVKGIKIMVAGRLNGAEIARREFVAKGKIPLQTIRADIDYATSRARTTYGIIGVKVWIYRGDVKTQRNSSGWLGKEKK